MPDDYFSRQKAKDKHYAESFETPEAKAWIAGMSSDERARYEKLGLLKPLLPKQGSTAPEQDAAESKHALVEAPTFEDIDPAQDVAGASHDEIFDALCKFACEVLSQGNARLALECLLLSCGMGLNQGESMTSIAKRYHVTRAAVSRRCVDITTKLNLPPSRAMRSKKARVAYRKVQIKNHSKQNV